MSSEIRLSDCFPSHCPFALISTRRFSYYFEEEKTLAKLKR
jgi:hypothetical protein